MTQTLPPLGIWHHEVEWGGGTQAGVGHLQAPGRPLGRRWVGGGGGQGVQGLVDLVQGHWPGLVIAAAPPLLDTRTFSLRLCFGDAGQVTAFPHRHAVTDGVTIVTIILIVVSIV